MNGELNENRKSFLGGSFGFWGAAAASSVGGGRMVFFSFINPPPFFLLKIRISFRLRICERIVRRRKFVTPAELGDLDDDGVIYGVTRLNPYGENFYTPKFGVHLFVDGFVRNENFFSGWLICQVEWAYVPFGQIN